MNKVLCVDDDPVAQKLYSILLKNAGYEMDSAMTAAMAIELVEMQPYSVAILDYMIPDMNGLELAGRLRRHHEEPIRKLPLIVCSASLDRKAVQQFTALGIRHFLVKPIEKEMLKQTLVRAAGSDWDGGAIQSLELICHNLGIGEKEALELLRQATEQLRQQAEQLHHACAGHNEPAVRSQCAHLRSTLGNLGLRSDEEWMIETRGLLTAIEADAETLKQDTVAQLSRLDALFLRLDNDLQKLEAPPVSDASAEAPPAAAETTVPEKKTEAVS